VTFLGQREQKIKLVDQERPPRFQGNEYHGPACEDAKSPGLFAFAVVSAAHFIFISFDIISLLIAFPYRRMRRLY
jgi:hypothetical protein